MNLKDAEIQYAFVAANDPDEDDLDQPIRYVVLDRNEELFNDWIAFRRNNQKSIAEEREEIKRR